MERYKIPLVNGFGRTIGYGDRWWTHRVRNGGDSPILGEKHVGITVACLDDEGRILVQHRRHRIFDKVWSLSGDTHPRKHDARKVESLSEAARRCAKEDLGVVIKNWRKILTVSYSARDPRDPRYCENELLYVLAAKHHGPLNMNRNAPTNCAGPPLDPAATGTSSPWQTVSGFTSSRSMPINGLTPTTTYTVQARVLGTSGGSDWSDPVSHICL